MPHLLGHCGQQPKLLRNKLRDRARKLGETLRELAAAIDGLTKKAYAHMLLEVQEELARDQFLDALGVGELCVQIRLACPGTLQEVLELAVERESIWAYD